MSTEAMAVEPDRRRILLGAVVFVVLTLTLLTWAKWLPYSHKVPAVAGSGTLGDPIVSGDGSGFSLSAGLDFAKVYLLAVWPALVAGLVIAAAVSALVPRDWLRRALGGTGTRTALRGAALSLPTMMCTCCAAPVAVGLRRRGASAGATLAFWLGNPALNPAVVAFTLFVLGWQWALLRIVVGVALVVGMAAWVEGRLSRSEAAFGTPTVEAEPAPDRSTGVPLLFARRLAEMAVRLLPEYLLLVVLLGAVQGVLFGPAFRTGAGTAAVVATVGVAVVAGTLLPIPTAGEVPVVAALLLLGVSTPVAAALLITLPALSLPSLLMVRRVLPGRLLWAAWCAVALAGLATAGLAAALSL